MIFSGGFIIRAGGFDFVVDISDGLVFAIKTYLGLPFLYVFMPGYSLVFRWRVFCLKDVRPVEDILCACCGPEVGFSIVETIMVDMVEDKAVWRLDYFVVHLDVEPFAACADSGVSAGIEGVFALDSIPFVLV